MNNPARGAYRQPKPSLACSAASPSLRRNTLGALAMVQEWRKSMLRQKGKKDLTENVNDQSLFNQAMG